MPAEVDGQQPEQRIVEAAALLATYGGVTGWAALRWAGGNWFGGLTNGGREERPVTLAIGGNVRPQPGVSVCEEGITPRDLTRVDGLAVTTFVRSVCFEMRYAASDRLAVVALDMAAFSDLVSIEELAEYARVHNSWTGIPRCRAAIPFADENSWSPPEVLMRLAWEIDAGLPRPLCNVPIFDRFGQHIGTPDLFDPERGLVGEYDGALHLEGARRAKDLRREEVFRSHRLEYVTMVAADNRDPVGFVSRLQATYRRARPVPEALRTWTIEPPAWWRSTSTVADRRSLSEDQRRRWLRHRSG